MEDNMKKIIVAAIAIAFLAAPAFATDFKAAQSSMLEKITANMTKFKGDAAKTDLLTKKKACVEKAKDAKGLADCQAIMSQGKMKKKK